jgi:spore germination protein
MTACSSGSGGTSTVNSSALAAGTASPGATAPSMKVSGWLPTWTGQTGKDSIIDNTGRGLDESNPFWYGLKSDGTMKIASQARDTQFMAAIWAAGGEVIPTIHDVADKAALTTVMASTTLRKKIVAEILAEVDTYKYDGFDIDFEHVKTSNNQAFHEFLKELGDGLHARGKILSIAIPGKRRDSSWAGYDYDAVGPLVDRFKIMTYGYSGPWSTRAGPIAPSTYISQVLDYAIPKVDPSKIYIGIPFYGYDWPSDGSKIRSVTWKTVQSRIAKSSGGVTFDPKYEESTFTYSEGGVSHEVWFQDERSIAAKCALVHKYKVAGIAIWAIGYGGDSFWQTIENARKPVVAPAASAAP